MTTRTVTSTFYEPDGTPLVGATVRYSLVDTVIDGVEIVQPADVTGTTNSSGVASVALEVPANYAVTTPSGAVYRFYLAAGTTVDLSTLISIPPVAGQVDAVQTLLNTHDANTNAHSGTFDLAGTAADAVEDHEAAEDPHSVMLAGDAFAYAADVRVDQGIHYIPFGVYVGVNPFSAGGYPYVGVVDRDLTAVSLRVGFLVQTTNWAQDYWTISLYALHGGATIATVNTSAAASDAWAAVDTTTFVTAELTADMVGIYVEVAKVGSPGTLYVSMPCLAVETHEANP